MSAARNRTTSAPASVPAKKTAKKAAAKNATKTAPAAAPEKVASIKVSRMKLADLIPHPRNPRTHPDPESAEWKVLEASLAHDYFDPIVWNVRNGMLVSGHLRTKVLTAMGFAKADVVVVDYDEPTHIARMMAANKAIGENDVPKMKELFGELRSVEGFPLALSGFTLPEVNDLVPLFTHTTPGSWGGETLDPNNQNSSEGMAIIQVTCPASKKQDTIKALNEFLGGKPKLVASVVVK